MPQGSTAKRLWQWVEQALQTLSPYERAVWILQQRWAWPFERIAKRLRTRDFKGAM